MGHEHPFLPCTITHYYKLFQDLFNTLAQIGRALKRDRKKRIQRSSNQNENPAIFGL